MTNKEIREALGKVAVELNELMQDEGSDEQHFIDILAEVDAALESEKPLAVVEGWVDSADLVVAENGITTLFISECEDQQIGAMLPVTVTITERKP